jgi:hypothetical protein
MLEPMPDKPPTLSNSQTPTKKPLGDGVVLTWEDYAIIEKMRGHELSEEKCALADAQLANPQSMLSKYVRAVRNHAKEMATRIDPMFSNPVKFLEAVRHGLERSPQSHIIPPVNLPLVLCERNTIIAHVHSLESTANLSRADAIVILAEGAATLDSAGNPSVAVQVPVPELVTLLDELNHRMVNAFARICPDAGVKLRRQLQKAQHRVIKGTNR